MIVIEGIFGLLFGILFLILPIRLGWFIVQSGIIGDKKTFAKHFTIGFMLTLLVFIIGILIINLFELAIHIVLLPWAYLLLSSVKRARKYAEKHDQEIRGIIVPFWTGIASMLTCLYPIMLIIYGFHLPVIDFLMDIYDEYCKTCFNITDDWNSIIPYIVYLYMDSIAVGALLLLIIIYKIINHVKKRKEEKSRYMNNDQSEG